MIKDSVDLCNYSPSHTVNSTEHQNKNYPITFLLSGHWDAADKTLLNESTLVPKLQRRTLLGKRQSTRTHQNKDENYG